MCAAGSAPDELRGEEVAVFVVLHRSPGNNTGAKPASESAAEKVNDQRAFEIVQWALEQMAYYKAPGWIAFIDKLPVTATQKLLRGELKTLLAETLAADEFIDTRHLKKRRV